MTNVMRALLFGERPLSVAEHLELQARIRKALALLPALAGYQAEIQQPCACGCLIWLPVRGGYRCARCMPPLSLPAECSQMIEATLPRKKEMKTPRNDAYSDGHAIRPLFVPGTLIWAFNGSGKDRRLLAGQITGHEYRSTLLWIKVELRWTDLSGTEHTATTAVRPDQLWLSEEAARAALAPEKNEEPSQKGLWE